MIVYRCDRCKRDIDLGVRAFDGEECLALDTKPYNCRGSSQAKHYLLCETCASIFENFMKDYEDIK